MAKIRKLIRLENPVTIAKFAKFKETFVYICVLISSFALIAQSNKLVSVHYTKYPVQEMEFIKINNLKGNLFTGFHNGSYLAYKLFPQNLIFMDGRYEEVYYPHMLTLLGKFHLVYDDWDAALKMYHTDVLLVDKKYEIYNHIKQNKDYALVFDGAYYAVFVPKEDVKEYKYPKANQQYYDETKFETEINWKS